MVEEPHGDGSDFELPKVEGDVVEQTPLTDEEAEALMAEVKPEDKPREPVLEGETEDEKKKNLKKKMGW